MSNNTDAYGNALMDCFLGKEDRYVVERDDNFLSIGHLTTYFKKFDDWGEVEKRMPDFVTGRILDVGCGAGRHALHLQSLGHEVIAIDKSPLAVEVAKRRGVVHAIEVSVDDFVETEQPGLGIFDGIIMMGHNIGLLHGMEEGKKTLRWFAEITTPNARIVGTTIDSRDTDKPEHLIYQASNLQKGRMRGQIRFRIRHGIFVSDWLDYLLIAPDELSKLAEGTGWKLETTIKGDAGFGRSSYLAVLCKT